MNEWILASDLLADGRITEVNLISAVKSDRLTAFDIQTDQPINWEEEEEIFNEVKDSFENMNHQPISLEEEEEEEEEEEIFNEAKNIFENKGRKPLGNSIKLRHETDKTINFFLDDEAPNIQWNYLHFIIFESAILQINMNQYIEILEGWGNRQISHYVKNAKFKTQDVIQILSSQSLCHTDKSSNQTHQSKKKETTDLHIIGGLLELIKGEYDLKRYDVEHLPIDKNSKIIEILTSQLDGLLGTSKRTLEARFSAAKKAINTP